MSKKSHRSKKIFGALFASLLVFALVTPAEAWSPRKCKLFRNYCTPKWFNHPEECRQVMCTESLMRDGVQAVPECLDIYFQSLCNFFDPVHRTAIHPECAQRLIWAVKTGKIRNDMLDEIYQVAEKIKNIEEAPEELRDELRKQIANESRDLIDSSKKPESGSSGLIGVSKEEEDKIMSGFVDNGDDSDDGGDGSDDDFSIDENDVSKELTEEEKKEAALKEEEAKLQDELRKIKWDLRVNKVRRVQYVLSREGAYARCMKVKKYRARSTHEDVTVNGGFGSASLGDTIYREVEIGSAGLGLGDSSGINLFLGPDALDGIGSAPDGQAHYLDANSSASGANEGASGGAEDNAQSAFKPVVAQSSNVNPHFLLKQGTLIHCSLDTKINSQLGGFLRCTIKDNVYSADGALVLLDRGSTLYGQFGAGAISDDINRLYITWTEARTPQNILIPLGDAPATDALGATGAEGYVDNRYLKRFGAGIFLSVLDDAVSLALNKGGSDEDKKDSRDDWRSYSATRESARDMANTALNKFINIRPVLYKNQGELISVYVNRDVDFSEVYRLELVGGGR